MRTVWPPAVQTAVAVPVASTCEASAWTGPTFVPQTWATTPTTAATFTSGAMMTSPTATFTRPSWVCVAAAAGPAAVTVSSALADTAASAFLMRGMELSPFGAGLVSCGRPSCFRACRRRAALPLPPRPRRCRWAPQRAARGSFATGYSAPTPALHARHTGHGGIPLRPRHPLGSVARARWGSDKTGCPPHAGSRASGPALEDGRRVGGPADRMLEVQRRVGRREIGAHVGAAALGAQQRVARDESHQRVGVAEQTLEALAGAHEARVAPERLARHARRRGQRSRWRRLTGRDARLAHRRARGPRAEDEALAQRV